MGKKKKKSMWHGGRFHGDTWLDGHVTTRTYKALADREASFPAEHKDDTDEQLLDYLRKCARLEKKTPHQSEVVGGKYISVRLGNWDRAVCLAGLPPTGTPADYRRCRIFKEEFKQQVKAFKADRSAAFAERRVEAEADRRLREERDAAWGVEHGQDADEQLIEYLRACAAELGRSPLLRDVTGGYYIAERFGGWIVALLCAEIHVPSKVGPPKAIHIKAYEAWLCVHAPGKEPILVPGKYKQDTVAGTSPRCT